MKADEVKAGCTSERYLNDEDKKAEEEGEEVSRLT